ncbi:MAG: hypothetical protein MO846_11525 [Candidatus Devosia symbiotica]|nr:hypothetical protein [Candidatus Devosia symbiotica]
MAISVIGAFVSMNSGQRHFEIFMKVYIFSCVIASILSTIGLLTQMDLLPWDGRARRLVDDSNIYGLFLIPAVVFCAYFLSRDQDSKLVLSDALAIVLLGILLSFSRIAVVAAMFCFFTYVFISQQPSPAAAVIDCWQDYPDRRRPVRLRQSDFC